ncbi:hypothetical protein GVAV_000700 [Gurleya vavrai]
MFGSSSSSVEIKIREHCQALNLKSIQSLILWLNNKDKKPRFMSIYKKNKIMSINIFFMNDEVNGFEMHGQVIDMQNLNDLKTFLFIKANITEREKEIFRRNNLIKKIKKRKEKNVLIEPEDKEKNIHKPNETEKFIQKVKYYIDKITKRHKMSHEKKENSSKIESVDNSDKHISDPIAIEKTHEENKDKNIIFSNITSYEKNNKNERFEEKKQKENLDKKIIITINYSDEQNNTNNLDSDEKQIIEIQEETEKLFKVDLNILTEENIKDLIASNYKSIYGESEMFVTSVENLNLDYSQFEVFEDESPHFLISIDCEMVMTEKGHELGRISLLDHKANILYDKIIENKNEITDYLTEYSGLTKESYVNCISFEEMKKDIRKIIGKNTVILGHSLFNDLMICKILHKKLIDTSFLFRSKDNRRVSLRILARNFLGRSIQKNTHCSSEDAECCLQLLALKVEEKREYKEGKNKINYGCETRFCNIKDYESVKNQKGINIFECAVKKYKEMKIENNYKNRFMMIFYEKDGKVYFMI